MKKNSFSKYQLLGLILVLTSAFLFNEKLSSDRSFNKLVSSYLFFEAFSPTIKNLKDSLIGETNQIKGDIKSKIESENSESKKSSSPVAKLLAATKSKISKKLKAKKTNNTSAKNSQKTSEKTPKKNYNIFLNDPAMSQQWGLNKADILRAWDVSTGSHDIIVAVIDTGIDIMHPSLRNNLWVNSKEINGKPGVDDDKNGCIDDIYGCNFIDMTGDLTDNHGHGTHIAGIIGAEKTGPKSVRGVSPKVSLMTLKYYDPHAIGTNNLKNTIKAIHYAIDMKKRRESELFKQTGIKKKIKMIINYSGGGSEFSKEEYQAVARAQKNDILFVAAAGNEKSNSDQAKYYPASYDLNNIVSITAIDPKTKVLASSNWGTTTVDIAAPGENIYSTMPDGEQGFMTGTSQATAFATGVAALVLAHRPDHTASQVKKYLLATGDELPTLKLKTGTSKKLNSYRALIMLDLGVSAMGVLAQNTLNMPTHHFASDPNDRLANLSETNRIAHFSKSLLDVIKHAKANEEMKKQKDFWQKAPN